MDRSFVDSRDRERGEGLKRCVRRDVRLEQCFSRGPARLVRRTDSCEKVIKRGRCIQRRLEQRNGYIPLLFTFETKESLFSLSLSFSFFVRYATDGKHRTAFQHIQRLRGTISRVFALCLPAARLFNRKLREGTVLFLSKFIDYRGFFALP